MHLRERRIAQIVRDFFEAYALSDLIGVQLRSGELDFARVQRFVGESEESALYRLKEECHALFRHDVAGDGPRPELQAEELFDLAVGGLFHEAMRFREGYYLTTSYGPRLDRMLGEVTVPSPLATAFHRVFEAGHRRMLASHAETQELLRETREQLRILLRQAPHGGVLARTLVEQRARTEEVFQSELPVLLDELFGSAAVAYRLAIESLVEHGHYAQAASLLERDDVRASGEWAGAEHFARAMDRHDSGAMEEALELLAEWEASGAPGGTTWAERGCRVLDSIGSEAECGSSLRGRARALAEKIRSGSRS
jgi:hypothetical protein